MNYPGLEHLRVDVAALSNAMCDVRMLLNRRYFCPASCVTMNASWKTGSVWPGKPGGRSRNPSGMS